MSDPMKLLKAMNELTDEDILTAQELLGYGAARHRVPGRKKLRRTLLIAAVLTALFTVTAYAAGLFGLDALLLSGSQKDIKGKQMNYVSVNGLADSPAGQAHAEWAEYEMQAREAIVDAEANPVTVYSDDEPLQKAFHLYGAYNDDMAKKLVEIQDKYQVRLHTEMLTPKTADDFFTITGAKPFILAEEDAYKAMYEYLYEDGSFESTVLFYEDDGPYLHITRGAVNALSPAIHPAGELADYAKWSYETGAGAQVEIAQHERDSSGYIFYQEGDYFLTVRFSLDGGKEAAEQAAERIDFSAACQGSWQEAEKQLAKVQAHYATLPKSASKTGEAITLEDFLQTPEYKALNEFGQLYREHMGIQYPIIGFMGVYGHPYGAMTEAQGKERAERDRENGFGIFGYGDENTDADILAVCEKYDLTYPTYKEFLSDNAVPYGYNGGIWAKSEREKSPSRDITPQEKLTMLGQGDIGDGLQLQDAMIDWYDTGAFQADNYVENQVHYILNYIPKGTLFTCIYGLGDSADYTDVRMIDTACGAVVCLATGNPDPYQSDLLLYESPNAYILIQSRDWKLLADKIDFTQFK